MKLPKSICFALLASCSVVLMPVISHAQTYMGGPTPGSINPLETNRFSTQNTPMPSAMPRDKPGAVFGDKVEDEGWEGMAKLLEAIAPAVDTRVPLTPSDITRRIEELIRANRLDEALKEVQSRIAAEANRTSPGTDVQLMFLHARVLTELKRTTEAEAIYQRMTMRFPELPEPWNNLAVIYAQRDEFEQARRALEMAIMINPKYAFAQYNMGDIELNLALKAFLRAAAAGAPGAKAKIKALKVLIEEQPK